MGTAGLTIAAVLCVTIAIVHSWLGERQILRIVLAATQDRRQSFRRIVRGAWHLTSFAWAVCGAVLAVYAVHPPGAAGRAVIVILGAFLVVNALTCLFVSGVRHPGVPIFLLAGLAALSALI